MRLLTREVTLQNGTRAVRREIKERFESQGISVFFIGEWRSGSIGSRNAS